MIDFIIKSTVSLAAFLAFYDLVLEREKMHHFNRFYLLISVVISLAIPFVTYEIIEIIPVVQNVESVNLEIPPTALDENPILENAIPLKETINYIPSLLWSLYGIITTLFLFRFTKNIWKLIQKSKTKATVNYKNATLILVEEKTLPHSFLNFIFINFDDYNNRTIEDELYTHELVHVTQKHTLDILFIELLKCIFWLNPLVYFYKKAIQLNHEFLADEAIVKTYNDVPFYQNLLLQKSSTIQTIYLASNLNYLVTKKRLLMMTKSTSQKIAILKKIAIIPILGGLVYIFCIKVVAQEKVIGTYSKNNNLEITDKDKIRDSYYSGVYVKIIDERINRRDVTLYEKLSLDDKRKYLSFIPGKRVEKEIPVEVFELLKTENNYIVIDGKVSNKEEIKKHKRNDFSYFTKSSVSIKGEKNATKYHYALFTKSFYDKNIKNSHLHFTQDTVIIGHSVYRNSIKDEILKKSKIDTIISQKTGNDEYNLYINDNNDKSESPKKQEKKTTQTVKEADYFQGVQFILRDGGKNGKIIIDKVYEELTEDDKEKLGKYIFLIPKPFQKMSPTQKEMEDFKNSKKYAIWIDGKNVPNDYLNKYKPNEIAHFSGSVILKNARSKKFPQPFQYWFSTHKYFEDTKMGVQQTKYGGDKVEVWLRKK
ncbi:M56 family metallopeptidase [Flavobacterium sp.]|uniref:M56 family metallopeptidase n=1 Tax=Flavobacterium sp. TaxID=239 RepID=UPI002489135F|nr:M56 family metallopeptidase [Flavobacterium sp.]MDI1316155.1 M56 family metallopeptidase [Flavobacterium sp.]